VIIILETWYSGGEGWMSAVDVSHNLFQVGPFTTIDRHRRST